MMIPNDSAVIKEEEEEDVGALIYRESQLRKAEAVAEKKISTALTRRRTSTRKRSHVTHQNNKPLPTDPKCNILSKRKREETSSEEAP